MSAAAAMLAALVIDMAFGWPDGLYRRIGHPVTWIGKLIETLDRRLNLEKYAEKNRRVRGAIVTGAVVAAAALPAMLLEGMLPSDLSGALLAGVLAWPLIATRSLHDHVAAVAGPLAAGDLAGARAAVAHIVGRDPEQLDAPGVGRAALESLAENASDGVVAPVFWGLLLGLPGIAAYKAINTLDSMIGHKTDRHGAFGWAAAKLDDLVNLIPARLTGLLVAGASDRPTIAVKTMLRDGKRHRSPNAGWPEAALAGGLNVRLSGPRRYGASIADEPWLNGEAPDPKPADVRRGLIVYRRAMFGLGVILAVIVLID